MSLGFFIGGIGVAALAFAIYGGNEHRLATRVGAAFLLVAGLALFVVGAFPTDVEGSPVTSHGTIHNLLSQVVFTLGPIGILLVSASRGRKWFLPTLSAFILTGAFFATEGILSLNMNGLAERLFILVLLSWWLLASYSEFELAA